MKTFRERERERRNKGEEFFLGYKRSSLERLCALTLYMQMAISLDNKNGKRKVG